MKRINEGAEAVIYETSILGAKAVLKRRVEKSYRIKDIDKQIRSSRSKNEARTIALASKAGIGSPRLLLLDGYDIYMTFVNGERFDKIVANGGPSAKVLEEVGKSLGAMHNANISHGDYTPANLVVESGKVAVIDFGLSQITNSVEAKALDVLLMKRAITKKAYASFITGYRKTSSNQNEILKRLSDIERRGRYQSRTILSA